MIRTTTIDGISIFKPEYVNVNVEEVCKYCGINDKSHLRRSFLTAINSLQKHKFRFELETNNIHFNLCNELNFNYKMLDEFVDANLSHQWQYYGQHEIEGIRRRTAESLDLIKDVLPNIYTVIFTIVGS